MEDLIYGKRNNNLIGKWEYDNESNIHKEETSKHYLGDVKWVLYTYVSDLQSRLKEKEELYFVCGKFAFSKLKNMSGFETKQDTSLKFGAAGISYFHEVDEPDAVFDLNGEIIRIYLDKKIEPKNISISKRRMFWKDGEEERPTELLKQLYFA